MTDSSGNATAINKFDEYGNPQSSNAAISAGGRFQYTGQAWLPELGLYYYKARIYNPALGRFMQTDPIGYGDGMNLYNYVGGDPVNASDPSGTLGEDDGPGPDQPDRPEPDFPTPRKVCEFIPGSKIVTCLAVGDENGDGVIDSRDANVVRTYFRIEFAGGPDASSQQHYVAAVNRILRDPNIAPSVRDAIRLTLSNSREHGFWVYFSSLSNGLWAGSMEYGDQDEIIISAPCQLLCPFSTPVLFYHTHPNGAFGFSVDDIGVANRHGVFIVADHFSGLPPYAGPVRFGGRAVFRGRRR